MLTVATLLWDANRHSLAFSKDYDESWVEKLYRGFRRNLTVPFRFVVFVDYEREFAHPEIEQRRLSTLLPGYANCIEPYRMGEPMILCGLDTIVTANCDRLAAYALHDDSVLALPRDPYAPERACNGVALVPAGQAGIHERWNGENDMEWLRAQPHVFIDDLFPGAVLSYKGHVKKSGLREARIVYFHGHDKAPEAMKSPSGAWIKEHWL